MALTDRVRIVSIPEGCGGTLSAASITGLTPATLASYNLVEHNKAKVIAMAKEAREIGVIGSSLMDLFYSRIQEVGKDALVKSSLPGMQSVILPYSYRNRKARIGNAQFLITAGSVNANAGTTVGGIVYPDSARNIVVGVGPGYVSNVTDLHRYFLPGTFVYVEGINTGTSAKTVTPLKVVTASTTAGVTTVVVAANRTDTWWGTATNGEKAPYQPTHGVLYLGNNNVSDYESWCYNEPTNLSRSLIVDYFTTSRYTQCITQVYEDTLKGILAGEVNELAKSYNYLSIAEQNKQMAKQHESKTLNDLFYSDIEDENQSPETYNLLPPVLDAVDDSLVLGYKARALGIRTLLANAGQVIDLTGGPLDLDVLLEKLYDLYRIRKADGSNVEVIDLMTDKDTAAVLRGAFRAIQTAFYGADAGKYYTTGQVLEGVRAMFKYEKFQIPALPFDVAVFVHEFFTDRIAAFGDGSGGLNGSVNLKNSARTIMALDWSDIVWAIQGTNSARREFGGKVSADALELFSCRIKLNPKKIDLRSVTWTLQIGDELRSLMLENYSLAAPTYTLGAGAGLVYS